MSKSLSEQHLLTFALDSGLTGKKLQLVTPLEGEKKGFRYTTIFVGRGIHKGLSGPFYFRGFNGHLWDPRGGNKYCCLSYPSCRLAWLPSGGCFTPLIDYFRNCLAN